MTVFNIPRPYPDPARWEDKVRNGKQPDHRVASLVANRSLFALAHQRKLVFARSTNAASPPQGVSGTRQPWRWTFRTGEHTLATDTITMRCTALCLPAATSGTDPRFQVQFGAISSNVGRYTFFDNSPTFDQLAQIDVEATGLAADTIYGCTLDVIDYARVVALSVWEEVTSGADTAATYVTDRSAFAVGNEITDAQHQELVTDTHAIWKHNGAHLFSLAPDAEAGVWRRTTASDANLLDQSASTTVSANTPGVNVQSAYMNPYHTDNLACVLYVNGVFDGAAPGGTFKVVDSGGTLATLSNFATTAEWKTTTFNLDGSGEHKVDFHFQGDGADQLGIYSVCAYVYVA